MTIDKQKIYLNLIVYKYRNDHRHKGKFIDDYNNNTFQEEKIGQILVLIITLVLDKIIIIK